MSNAVLKNVAVSSFASQTLANETYEGMVRWALEELKQGHDIHEMNRQIKEIEKEMKALYEAGAMPSAWRSAKSVVMTAVGMSIPLTEEGKVRGKTDLETRIKVHRATANAVTGATSSGRMDTYMYYATKLQAQWSKLTLEEQALIPHPLRLGH